MLIDWFTVGAQMLNFLILVWMMQRFLYKPILRAIDAREKQIALKLAEADLKKAEAQKERDEFQRQNEAFGQQRAARLSQMADEVEAERQRLLDAARGEADAFSAKRMETLRSDAHALRQAISQRAQQEVFAITRKALADLAGAGLEAQMVDMFVRQVRALGGPEKEELKAAFKTAAGAGVVRSAFELPAAQRTALDRVIKETLGVEAPLRFETAPGLVGGIDLCANGRKVTWNIAAYLLALEKGVGELLEEQGSPEGRDEAKPHAKGETKSE